MKRYTILHRTYYNFSAPVELGPHELRLRPREGHELRIESSTLDIEPTAVLSWRRDAEDNSVAIARFGGATRQLAIQSELVVQQYNLAPLDFELPGAAASWPFTYSPEDAAALGPYRDTASRVGGHDRVGSWLDGVGDWGGERSTIVLLQRLNQRIHESLSYRARTEPGVQEPEVTLAHGVGTCRDFAALFMEAARRLGFAARFVSGYLRADPSSVDFGATHAWAEVFLPGAGWKGFDPTTCQLAGTDHFPVAVGHRPGIVPPVSGSFSGSASAALEVGVWVTELPVAVALPLDQASVR